MVLPSYLLRKNDEVQFCTCFEKSCKTENNMSTYPKRNVFYIYLYYLIFYFLLKFYYLQNLETTKMIKD
jgi:hypothetical protein